MIIVVVVISIMSYLTDKGDWEHRALQSTLESVNKT